MVRSDDIKRLLEVKDFNKSRSRRDSMGSDVSDRSDLSSKSMPQYSSYRSLSGGLLGPFENPPVRPGSRTGFLPWNSGKSNMSKLRTPTSKGRETAVRPRGTEEGSCRPGSRAGSYNDTPDGLHPQRRPSISRENSASRLPVYKRDASMPQINRDKATPTIRRERSEVKSKTSIASNPSAESATPFKMETTPKTVAQRKVVERNIAAKGTRSGVSGISNLFMIGDKVRIIASDKIGMVQFVGETKFAKGIWAGVVLPDATGKNDGSVAGVRYFSCPSLRGVFVKEDKLEKVTATDDNYTPKSKSNTLNQSALKASINRSETTISTDLGAENKEQDLNIGDKVYIASANNIRIGVLRYIGLTEFAKGTWCGIELEEALGKNDGAVAGKRYFHCSPKFGIFSQVQKVKKYCEINSFKEPHIILSSTTNDEAASTPATPKENESSPVTKSEEEIMLNVLEAVLQNEAVPSSEVSPNISEDKISHSSDVRVMTEPEVDIRSLEEQPRRGSKPAAYLKEGMLQNQVSLLEKEKSALENELHESKQKIENLQFQLEEQLIISEDLESSEQDCQKCKQQSKEFATEEERLHLQMEIEDLKKDLEGKNFQLSEKDMQLQSDEEAINKYKDIVDSFKQSENHMVLEITDLKEQIKSLTELQQNLNSMEDKSGEIKDHYEYRLSQKESTIFSLEERLVAIENRLSLISGELEGKSITIKGLEDQVEKQSFELEENNISGESLRKSITDLNEQLSARQSDVSFLIMSNETLQKDKVDLNEQLNRKLANLASYSSINEVLKKENLDFIASLEVLEARNLQLVESKRQLEEAIMVASKSSGDSAEQTWYLNEQIQAKNRELSTLKDHENHLVAENNKLESQINDYKQKVENEIRNIESETNLQIQKLQDSLHLSENNSNALKSALEDLLKKNQKLEHELENSMKEVSHLNGNASELKTVKEELRTLMNTHKVMLEMTEKDTLLKNNELGILRAENGELITTTESLLDQNNIISNELNSIKNEQISLKKLLDEINKEKDKLIKDIDDKSIQLRTELESSTKYFERAKFLENTNSLLETSKKDLENKCALLSEELKKLISSVDHRDVQMSKVQSEALENSSIIEKLRADMLALGKEADDLKSQLAMVEKEKSKWNIISSEKEAKYENRINSLENELNMIEHLKQINPMINQNQNFLKQSAGSGYDQLKEEIQTLKVVNSDKEKQVEFLNSIIVDLQNKNKLQQEKIDILSYGDDVKELDGNLDVSMSPIKSVLCMRSFCDICDEFDLHETEDCPRQSNVFEGVKHHGKRGEERPYCHVCESFGHTPDTCDEEQTF